GGMGFIEETGAAQYYRDTKITQIYEGTNGIQAMDLVGRKLPMRAGGVYQDQLARMKATIEELAGAGDDLAVVHRELAAAVDALEDATNWILSEGLADPVQALSAASPYQRLFATTVAGWLMAIQGLAAKRVVDAGGADADLAAAKIVTSRFFAEQLLPAVHGLVAPVKAGKGDLFALTADQL
ncbi:MAG: acyl-CoA dehydrogenase, partial [Acidimicrobiales bacterium]|nr:acyl-CoA dehydrogenase [Acidimicrobiales bacterium]